MKRYILTPSAKRDVNDVWDYIANDSIEAADRVLDALESAMIKLAKSHFGSEWEQKWFHPTCRHHPQNYIQPG